MGCISNGMYRFFSPSKNISGNKIILDDKKQVHHLKDVLRLKINDKVTVCAEQGNEYHCLINQLSNNKVILEIEHTQPFSKSKQLKISVACAIPKKSKMDEIIDKLTQLGVDRIIPLLTERVVIKLDKHKEMLKLARWKKIAQSAAQQSQRNTLPIIEPVKNIREVLLERDDYDLKLIPTLMGERKSLKEILAKSKPKNILVLIGPEGDFSESEVALAIKSGCLPISLGELVLRVETAAVAVVSILNYTFK